MVFTGALVEGMMVSVSCLLLLLLSAVCGPQLTERPGVQAAVCIKGVGRAKMGGGGVHMLWAKMGRQAVRISLILGSRECDQQTRLHMHVRQMCGCSIAGGEEGLSQHRCAPCRLFPGVQMISCTAARPA